MALRQGVPQYPGMGRALFIPYFAGLAQPPLAFPAMALRQGRTIVPWDGPGAVHPIFCWLARSRRRLFRLWLCGKGIPQYPGDGHAVHPIFCWLAQPPLAFPTMALWQRGTPPVSRGWPGAVHPIFCWLAAAAGSSGYGFVAKAHHSIPGMGGRCSSHICWVGAAAAGFSPAMAVCGKARTSTRGWAGRCSSHILLVGAAAALFLLCGCVLALRLQGLHLTIGSKRPPLREPFSANALA